MQEKIELIVVIDMIINNPIFKWTIGTAITTLTGWALLSVKDTNNKIKNAVSKSELQDSERKSKLYTNNQIKIHEDKQILELSALSGKVNETHTMVSRLLDIQLNKR